METPLRAFLWISLVSHVAAGALILGNARIGAPSAPGERRNATSSDTFDAPERELSLGTESQVASRLEGSLPHPHSLPTSGERGRHAAVSASGEGRGGVNAEARSGLFGAVGDRAAMDLATAFTRGFPQAASSDPAWASAPFGAAGEAAIAIEIADNGAWVGADVEGSPGPALRAGIARTIALLRARTFTASGRVTRLGVSAKVTPDEVHDGLHGEVFAIGGSFDAAQGSAFFALAIGRRIDLQVRKAR